MPRASNLFFPDLKRVPLECSLKKLPGRFFFKKKLMFSGDGFPDPEKDQSAFNFQGIARGFLMLFSTQATGKYDPPADNPDDERRDEVVSPLYATTEAHGEASMLVVRRVPRGRYPGRIPGQAVHVHRQCLPKLFFPLYPRAG